MMAFKSAFTLLAMVSSFAIAQQSSELSLLDKSDLVHITNKKQENSFTTAAAATTAAATDDDQKHIDNDNDFEERNDDAPGSTIYSSNLRSATNAPPQRTTNMKRKLDISNPLDATNWGSVSTSCVPAEVKARIQDYAPVWDFDGDGCLPAAAISKTGQQNGGLKISGSQTGGCRSSNFMARSNTYHRWNTYQVGGTIYEFHIYELYFEKDQTFFGSWMGWLGGKPGGHRHDVESVIIMFKNSQPTKIGVSAHGDYITRSWSSVPKSGTHVKVVYHQEGGLTHALRYAGQSENTAENPTKKWVTPPLVSWYHMGNFIRSKLNTFSFGTASMKTIDGSFDKDVFKLFPQAEGASTTKYPVYARDKFSEEGDGQSTYGLISLIKCEGQYCDNLTTLTLKDSNKTDWSKARWTGSFSEEKSSWTSCPSHQFVTRIQCRGSYCDDKRLLCAPLRSGSGMQSSGLIHYSGLFSEENGGTMSCPSDYYLVGMKCDGKYCDNLRLKCRKVISSSTCA